MRSFSKSSAFIPNPWWQGGDAPSGERPDFGPILRETQTRADLGTAIVSGTLGLAPLLTPEGAKIDGDYADKTAIDSGQVTQEVGAVVDVDPLGALSPSSVALSTVIDASGGTLDAIVNTTTAAQQFTPVIATLSSGGWVVIWASDANGGDVLGQVFDASGARLGNEFAVSSTTTASQRSPAVAPLLNGGFIVAWQDGRGDQGDYNRGDIYAQRFDATGARVGSETSVATITTGLQTNPDISVARDGSYLISWTTAATVSGQSDHAWIARYDAAGNKLGADIDATSFSGGTDDWVALSAGHYAVGYVSGSDVRARFVDIAGNGVSVGTSFLLNDTTLQYGNPTSLSIVSLADGGIAAAWITADYFSGLYLTFGVGSRTFDSSGARGTAVTDVTSTSTYYDISIAALADGYVVSWGGDVGTSNNVSYARAFDDSGDAIGGRFQVNVTPGGSASHIAGLASGGFVASFAADEIRMRQFDAPTKLVGTPGDDHLTALSESTPTQIDGRDGADTLTGGLLADELHGGNGADTINGGSGNDIISGDAGGDTLLCGSGSDTIFAAQAGLETLYVPNFVSGLDRGTEIDTLSGGDGDDFLFAGSGDNVDGGAGIDALFLSVRNASAGIQLDLSTAGSQIVAGGVIAGIEVAGWIEGSDFSDTIVAGPQTAPGYSFSGYYGSIYGFGGDDHLTGGFYTKNLYGGDGNDTLKAAAIDSLLVGGAGADTITGGAGNDVLSSADGSSDPYFFYSTSFPFQTPVFDHGSEIDTLSGGAGYDTILVGYGDSADGGADGERGDTLLISLMGAPAGVTADFSQATQSFGGGTITGFEKVDWVEGTNYADTISFGSALYGPGGQPRGWQNVIAGGGNDTVTAGYYTQYIDGGDGDDTLDGRGSQYLSYISGGAGNDTLYGSVTATLSGGAGNDTIYNANGQTYGDGGDDLMVVSSSSDFAYMYGGDGSDEIRGGGGADKLYSAGATTMANGAVAPADDMGTEHDRISGGDGNDIVGIGYGDDADGGAGSDTLLLSLGGAAAGMVLNTASLTGATPFTLGGGVIQGFEILANLRGTEFADTITAATQTTALTVSGGAGDDTLIATGSAVTLQGDDGNDRLVTGSAADVLDGGAGIDTADYSSATAGITVQLSTGTGTASDGDRLRSIENVVGSNFNDVLKGNLGDNALSSGNGDDRLEGGLGNDTLNGGAGNDTLVGGVGIDVAVFSGNRSQYSFHANGDGSVQLVGPDGTDTVSGVERFQFSDGLYSFNFADAGTPVVANFAVGAGGWSSQMLYPRHVADVNGDGFGDIVGFGQAGVLVSYGSASGTFSNAALVVDNFGQSAGWTSDDLFHRELADVNGDGRADIIGFGQAGTLVSLDQPCATPKLFAAKRVA